MRVVFLGLVIVPLGVLHVAACGAPKVEGSKGGSADGGGTSSARADARASGAGGDFGLPDAGLAAADGPDGPLPGGSCAEQGYRAERAPLDLMFLVDSSGSMNAEVEGGTKWQRVHEALGTFLADPMSAGLGVGLSLFPSEGPAPVCTSDNDCAQAVPFSCAARRCVGAGGSVATALPCNGLVSLCPGTSSCLPIGRCAQSGLACAMGSRACPGGPGDTCEIGVRTCWQLVVDYGCDAAIYQNPRVGIADLPAAAPRLRGALDQVQPDGNTPVVPAVRGALAHLRAHQSAHPERRAALVLATDGLPEGCDTRPQSVAQVTEALAGARQATPSLPTYVIGVFAPDMLATSQPALAEMATAGGTGAPFILDPNQNLAARFLQALNQIRGAALACEFQIPRPASGAQDYGRVNVRFTRAPGAPPEDLVYVASPDRCDPARGGWYYDVPPALGTPTRIIVCDSTCRRFQAEAMGQVEIRIGCTTRID